VIPISSVSIGTEEEELVLQVLRSGRLAQGPMVERLEQEFRPWCGAEHVVAVSNGTVSLVAALEALQLPRGTEVITSPFTFVATLNAILEAGLVARFGDIDPRDFALTPESVEAVATERTSAIMPVHLYGQAADMESVLPLAERHGLAVIEDAAQAHGATYKGRRVGTFGHAAAFSFYPTKNLACFGDGGLVLSTDPGVAERVRKLREYGWQPRYVSETMGVNSRLDEVHAAVLADLLPQLDQRNERRRRIAADYANAIESPLRVQHAIEASRPSFHQFVLLSDQRDSIRSFMAHHGVETAVHFPLALHQQPAFQQAVTPLPLSHSERAAREILSLPSYPELEDWEVQLVRNALREWTVHRKAVPA